MENLQNQQILQTKNPYEALDKLGKDIVTLKLSGLSYQQIVEYLEQLGEKRENQTVRDWFSESGKYNEVYKYMKEQRRKEIEPEFEAVGDQIKEGAIEAIQVVRDKVKQGNLKAAMYMLRLAGLEEVQKIEEIQPRQEIDQGILFIRELITARRDAARLNRLSNNTSGNHTSTT